jgi:hypothetical protein
VDPAHLLYFQKVILNEATSTSSWILSTRCPNTIKLLSSTDLSKAFCHFTRWESNGLRDGAIEELLSICREIENHLSKGFCSLKLAVVAHVEGDPYGFYSYGFIVENSMLRVFVR